jgi:signal transduction histidine kinase/CheY-like chemotaxis protein/uncharacterized membrane protein YciS (DUF1049 family)
MAGWFLIRQRLFIAVLIAGFVLIISVLTLVQYVFELNLFIDELFHVHQIGRDHNNPGRMAPNTAICFLLSSAYITWLSRVNRVSSSHTIIALLASATLAISLVSILGYLLNVSTTYKWGELTAMALPTAIGFSFFSTGMLVYILVQYRANVTRNYQLCFIVAVVLLFVTVLFTNAVRGFNDNIIDSEINSTLQLIEKEVSHSWRTDFFKLIILSSKLKEQKNFENGQFDLPESMRSLWVTNPDNVLSLKYSAPGATDLSSLISSQVFHEIEENEFFTRFKVQASELFSVNNRSYFFIKIQMTTDENDNQVANEAIYLLVDFAVWLKNHVSPNLPPNYSKVRIQSRTDLAATSSTAFNRARPLHLPLNFSNDTLSLMIHDNSEHKVSNLAAIVFWIGLLISIGATVIIYFMQTAIRQSKRLSKEIEENKAAQQELAQSNLSLKLATEVAQLGIWIWNPNSGALTWDTQMFNIYEPPNDVIDKELYYQHWEKSLHPDDLERTSSSLAKAVEERKEWSEEFRIITPSKQLKYIKATAVCFLDQATSDLIVIGGNVDITEQKLLLEELARKTKQAEQNSLAKSHFLANMSHEIRTPMNAILGIGDLMMASNMNRKQHEYMKLITSSANTLLNILNDILDISKIEAGRLRIESICFPLEEVVADSLKSLSNLAHQKGLDYHFHCQSDVPLWVFSDPTRIGQIAINLVSNAIKFTSEGEVNVFLSLAENQEQNKQIKTVEIKVEDSGVGIPNDKLKELFKPFSQVDESTTREFGGTGLGLSIVKQLVSLLDGNIDLKSEESKGTTVTVNLPLRLGDKDVATDPLNDDFQYFLNNHESELKSINCLVVDHHKVSQRWLTDMLHSWKCNVTSVASAEEALKVVDAYREKGKSFHILLLERDLPDMDGFKFLNRIRAFLKEHDLPTLETVVMLSSNSLEDDIKMCESLQINEHLIKPVKQSEVFNALTSLLGKRSRVSEAAQPILKIEDGENLKVLVAEDHKVNQFLVKEILDARGHEIHIVENGRLAVEAVHQSDYDLILMDVQMPVMDGIEATKTIRNGEKNADICIIGLTARALTEDANICLDAGMNFYLTKPVNPTELLRVIENKDIRAIRQKECSPDAHIDEESTDVSPNSYTLFDETQALKVVGNNHALLMQVLNMTVEEIDIAQDTLNELERDSDWDALSQKLHQTKGMLANVSQQKLPEFFEVIITLLHDKNTNDAQSKLSDAVRDVKVLKAEILDYIAQANFRGMN